MIQCVRQLKTAESPHPGYTLLIIDPKVDGCAFSAKNEYVYTSKPIPIVLQDKLIYAQVNVLDTFVGDDPYWLIYYSFHLDECFAWIKKRQADVNTVIDVAKCCFSNTLKITMLGEDEVIRNVVDYMTLYIEDRLPGVNVFDFGELPNGILASHLAVNIKEVVGLFLAKEQEKTTDIPKRLDRTIVDNLVVSDAEKSKQVKEKRQSKQEKRLKNWNQAKNGKKA